MSCDPRLVAKPDRLPDGYVRALSYSWQTWDGRWLQSMAPPLDLSDVQPLTGVRATICVVLKGREKAA